MSASPQPSATPALNTKRPLDDESSASGPTDQPDAKRPALDKSGKEDSSLEQTSAAAESRDEATVPSTEEQATPSQVPVANGHAENQVDTSVPDAPDGAGAATVAAPETQQIQSTGNQYDRATSQGPTQSGHQDETGWIHIRAVITSAEAATIIGKGGENVSLVRRHSGAKCTISDYSRGAVERVLTVSGLVDAAAKVSRFPSSVAAKLTSSRPLG